MILKNYNDIHPFNDGPKFAADTSHFAECDKNFVYYWLNKNTFPNVKSVYLLSHPCDMRVLHRNFNVIYLRDIFYQRYKTRWAKPLDNIVYVEYGQAILNMIKFDPQEIKFIHDTTVQ